MSIPIGLAITTLTLLFVALANLFSKQIATISGVGFTLVLFIVFTISERLNREALRKTKKGLEQFNLDVQPEVAGDVDSCAARRASWSRFATTTAWRTCRACCRRRISAATTSSS